MAWTNRIWSQQASTQSGREGGEPSIHIKMTTSYEEDIGENGRRV